jgi:hypothetical protein
MWSGSSNKPQKSAESDSASHIDKIAARSVGPAAELSISPLWLLEY